MAKLSVGEFLSVLRKANGLTQEEAAERLGVSAKSVSSWENNRTSPDIMLLPIIAEMYGVTVDELVRGERMSSAEQTESEKKASTDSLRKIRRRKYAKYRGESNLYLWLAVISALISVAGCILTSFVAEWIAALAVVGFAGCVVFLVMIWNAANAYMLNEGVVGDGELTDAEYPIALVCKIRTLRAIALSSLPFLLYGAVMWLIFWIDGGAYTYEVTSAGVNFTVYGARTVLICASVCASVGIAGVIYALVRRFFVIRRLGAPEHKQNLKRNAISAIIFALLPGILCAAFVSAAELHDLIYGGIYDVRETVMVSDTFDGLTDKMMTYYADGADGVTQPTLGQYYQLKLPSELISERRLGEADSYIFPFPCVFDCGNGFVLAGRMDIAVWDIKIYDRTDGKYSDKILNSGDYVRGAYDFTLPDAAVELETADGKYYSTYGWRDCNGDGFCYYLFNSGEYELSDGSVANISKRGNYYSRLVDYTESYFTELYYRGDADTPVEKWSYCGDFKWTSLYDGETGILRTIPAVSNELPDNADGVTVGETVMGNLGTVIESFYTYGTIYHGEYKGKYGVQHCYTFHAAELATNLAWIALLVGIAADCALYFVLIKKQKFDLII